MDAKRFNVVRVLPTVGVVAPLPDGVSSEASVRALQAILVVGQLVAIEVVGRVRLMVTDRGQGPADEQHAGEWPAGLRDQGSDPTS